MKIAVLADSASYLTDEQVAEYDIKVLQIPIIWGDKTYHDLQDIGFKEFYKKLNTDKILPTTSTPSLGDIEQLLTQLTQQGYTDVIAVPLSSGISGFYSTLQTAAKNSDAIKLHVFDSKVTCAGSANMALLAAKMVRAGKSVAEILSALQDLRATTKVRFMVDDLSHLKRTGRLSNASSFIGGLLKIKPILSMDVQNEGKISAIAKERQAKKAYEHIKADFAKAIKEVDYPVQVTVFDADDPTTKADWIADLQESFPNVKVLSSIIGPVVGVHVGQYAMAIIWSRDIDSYQI